VISTLIQDPKNYVENPAKLPVLSDKWGQLEPLASTFDHVDGLFYFTYVVCIFFFVLITGVLALSVVKYRRKTFDQPAASNVTHNTPLEVIWTIIPLIIVMVMFVWGWKGSNDMLVAPADARQYKAVAKQWNWTFSYPGSKVQSYNELWLEVDKPAAFTLQSTDVLHAFFLPGMRVKRDVVPGRQQTAWFRPTKTGDYHLYCAEYCGKDHSKMYALVHVVSAEEYAKSPWDVLKDSTPEEAIASGENIYKALCLSCHSVNGTPGTGPSWSGPKGLFAKDGDKVVGRAREVVLADGTTQTVTVDEAYIKESIAMPNAKKVAELPYRNNNMSAFADLDERRVNCLIAYMKSLASN
jgi:cytochrome c oxidase subunit 2